MQNFAPICSATQALIDRSAAEQLEHAPVGFLCLTVDGVIGKVNSTLLAWTGYGYDELVGVCRFHDLIGAGARVFFDTHHTPLLMVQGFVNEIAIDLRMRDGGLLPVLVNTCLKRDAEGRPALVQMAVVNATERRRYERELLHARRQAELAAATLEQRVEERTGLLAAALADAGKRHVEQAPMRLRDVLDETVAGFVCLAHEKGLALRMQLDDEVPAEALGDAPRLAQMLANYLGNAIKFTERGEVRLLARMAGAARLRVEVRDTGVGLTPEQQQGLFGPLHGNGGQAAPGLATCRQLAEMMHGEVGVSSQAGAGSVFWFEVGIGIAPAAPAQAPGAVPGSGALAGKRILLAEDNPLNQELASILGKKGGASMTIVGNGADALVALAGASFDCVLMDLQMPRMDGFAATRQIRTDARFDHLPVIALTANAFASTREQCLAAGMDDFLVKPIDPPLFYATLARWVQGRRAAVPAPPAREPAPESGDTLSLSVLAALVDDDPETMARLLHIFLDNAAATITALQCAVGQASLADARALGHRLKSSARAVGALRLAESCEAIEQAAGLDEAAALVDALLPMLATLRLQMAASLALAPPQAALP